MHKYLRAIGFSNITKNDLQDILKKIIDEPKIRKYSVDSEGNEFAEYSDTFLPNAGISVRGIQLENDRFEMEYYYPYIKGTDVTTKEQIDVEKHAEKESYAGVCDDLNLGITLIFYLQNVPEYLMEKKYQLSSEYFGAVLAGLSTEGTILCPVQDRSNGNSHSVVKKREQHNQLIVQAREGDEEAIDSLTLEDMDIYAAVSERATKEDIFSIVKSTFMPYGIESDQYSILGEIVDYVRVQNKITEEWIYEMKLLCNGLVFDVCINEKDLYGEPAAGRRFRGNVWMQGSICFE